MFSAKSTATSTTVWRRFLWTSVPSIVTVNIIFFMGVSNKTSMDGYWIALNISKWISFITWKLIFSGIENIIETAKDLIDFCEFECQCILACSNCYESYYPRPKPEWNLTVCQVPHLIVWARLNKEFWPAKIGFIYWPAKLVSVDNDIAIVIFFGEHKFDDVRAQGCFLYSSTPPGARSTGNAKDMKPALEVRNFWHILIITLNWIEHFCWFLHSFDCRKWNYTSKMSNKSLVVSL